MIATTVCNNRGFAGLFADEPVAADAVVMTLDGEVVDAPSRHSLQFGEDRHLESPPDDAGGPSWRYLNHSCRPNTYVDVASRALRALRAISPGEELTFNYLTTELEMAEPFDCHCGASDCHVTIRGFAHVLPERRRELLPWLAPHLRDLVER